MRILVVEDEEEMAAALVEALRTERYAVDRAADGHAAEQLVDLHDYDLIVLDWSIPGPSGIELVQLWRERGLHVPVLMLTGRRTVSDRVGGLDAGADDYLAKPFAFAELLARVRTLLRRRERPVCDRLEADDLRVDPRSHEVTLGGRPLRLAPKEFALLVYLLARSDEVVSRTELSEHVWDEHFDPSSNVIDVLIYRLRKKIDGDREQRLLHTAPGAGYMIRSSRS